MIGSSPARDRSPGLRRGRAGFGNAARRGAATVAAASLLAWMFAVGEGSAASARPASTQSAAGLDVVVGKTVALTTDQKGNHTPLNIMLINGQVSGQGQGQVVIPTGPNATKAMDVQSSPGQVSDFFALGGSYGGDLPVTISTELTVDGKQVDPDQGYNLNGDVEIKYTFVNHTSRKEKITYKDTFGKERTKQVEVPLPFGDSFAVTFGDGWSVTDAGSMAKSTTPFGTQLTTSVILFPIVQGLVGGTTQTLTIKAKAENASLPSAKNTMVPVRLSEFYKGLILEVAPVVQTDLLPALDSTLLGVTGNVASIASLISGYTAGFQSLAVDHIDPLVSQIESVNVSESGLSSSLASLSSGLTRLGKLMVANAGAQDRVARLITAFANALGIDAPKLVKWLGMVVTDLADQAPQAAKGLTKLKDAIDATDLPTLSANAATMNNACGPIAPLSAFYGPDSVAVGEGAKALQTAISDGSHWPRANEPWVKPLKSLQAALDAEANGTLIDGSKYATIQSLDKIPPKVKAALLAPVCQTLGTLTTDVVVPYLADNWPMISGDITLLVAGLDALSDFAKSPAAKKAYNGALKDLKILSELLSNDSCTVRDVINPIISAIERYGVAGIKAHMLEVLEGVFSDCGLAQIVEFFGDFDRLLGLALGQLGEIVDGAQADVPVIVNGVDKVKGLAGLAGTAFDAIPGLGAEIGQLIMSYDSAAEGMAEGGIEKVSAYVGELGATLQAMDARVTAGDGMPGGAATGVPNLKNYASYQITMSAAEPNKRDWAATGVLAVIFLVIGAGVGTVLYRRRRHAATGGRG